MQRAWPDVLSFTDVADLFQEVSFAKRSGTRSLLDALDSMPALEHGLIVGGPPCQGFSALNESRQGFNDPRSDGVAMFANLVSCLRYTHPHIKWHAMMENVSSMTDSDRETITALLSDVHGRDFKETYRPMKPYWMDAALVGHIRRPRYYWASWSLYPSEFEVRDTGMGYYLSLIHI